MQFEWDENKRRTNLQKHGVDFVDAVKIFAGFTVTLQDDRFQYDENRFITFGMLKGRVVAVLHTERQNRIRLISIRKATRNERKAYFEQIAH